jgi:hypothetical protein
VTLLASLLSNDEKCQRPNAYTRTCCSGQVTHR